MARFELTKVKICDPDGVDREYAVIKDRVTFEKVEADFGPVVVGSGFLRCQGRRIVAFYGRETPVWAGGEDEIYYAPMSYFDGDWTHGGPDSRGQYTAVTAASGTGKLFAELEAFSAANNIAACS